MNEHGGETVGVFDKEMRRVVIRRDQLREASRFLGTLLHELEHAASGHGDGTLEFEDALTERMGIVAQLLVMASFNEGHDGHTHLKSEDQAETPRVLVCGGFPV